MSTRRPARSRVSPPATRPPNRRFQSLLAQLDAGRRVQAPDLARDLEVTVRTVYRDLVYLRDQLGAPIVYDRAQKSWRLQGRVAGLPAVFLTEGEVVALYFAERVLAQYRGTPFEHDLLAAFRKLEAHLPKEIAVRPGHLVSFLSFDPGPLHAPDAAAFRDVMAGILRKRRLLLRYQSLSSARTADRLVDPYRVYNHRGDWYLAAWDHQRKAMRDLALHRIRRVTMTAQTFVPDPDFDFEAYRADAFGIEKGPPVNVAVRFAPRQARWIRERKWHASARLQERLDGGCVLRLRVPLTSELVRWVLQFGSEAEVLAPASLRRRVETALTEALAAYRPSSPPRRRRPSP